MLRISNKILYLILLNVYIFNNPSHASFMSFFKNIFSSNKNTKNTNDEQVLSKDNKPVELKIPVSSYVLKQIKEINNLDIKNKKDSRIKDDNFNTIQTQQQQILGILYDYHYDKEVFNKCIINVKQVIAIIDFYNILFKQRNDFSKLIIELNDILDKSYQKALCNLEEVFNKILDIINLMKLVFKDTDGLINKLLLLDNTVGLNENERKDILNKYINQLDILLNKDTKKYYDNILLEFDVKIRNKNSVLPSQLLYILFYCIREELFNKNNELYECYIVFKNKITLMTQKLSPINDNINDNAQLQENSNSMDSKINNEEAINGLINSYMKEQNRRNSDVIDEIDRIKNVVNSLIDYLNVFKDYVPDEKILTAIEQAKESEKKDKGNIKKDETIKDNKDTNNKNDKDNKNEKKEGTKQVQK